MNYFWEIIASNAIVATILAIGVVLLSRVWKNAAAIHLLWVVVLLKFFTPPIVTAQLPFAFDWLPSAVSVSSADRPSNPLARERVGTSCCQTNCKFSRARPSWQRRQSFATWCGE